MKKLTLLIIIVSAALMLPGCREDNNLYTHVAIRMEAPEGYIPVTLQIPHVAFKKRTDKGDKHTPTDYAYDFDDMSSEITIMKGFYDIDCTGTLICNDGEGGTLTINVRYYESERLFINDEEHCVFKLSKL